MQKLNSSSILRTHSVSAFAPEFTFGRQPAEQLRRKEEDCSLARLRGLSQVRRPSLQFHQPVRGFRKDRELRQVPSHHCDFIAAMESRTGMAVFVDLIGKILALRDRESLTGEEIRFARE